MRICAIRKRKYLFCICIWICSLFVVYRFLNDESMEGLPAASHLRYKHHFRNIPVTYAPWKKQLESGSKSRTRNEVIEFAAYEHDKQKLSHIIDDPLSVPRIREYCNPPITNVTGDEGIVPPGYKLLHVHVVTRHGARSPMYSFINHHNPPLSCEFSQQITNNNPIIRTFINTMKSNEHKQNQNNPFYQWSLYPQRKVCDMSQLMAAGAMQHMLNGFHFRERYVKKWKLFGDSFSGEQIHVMSTPYSRTYQSSIALLYSFLPQFDLREINIERSASLHFCDERFFKSSCICPGARQLKKLADDEALHFNKNNTRLFKLQKLIGEVYGLKPNQLPTMWSMADVFMAYACNNIKPLPCNSNNGKCINSKMMAELWNLIDEYGLKLDNLKSYQHFMRVTMHPFLVKVLDHINLIIKNKTKVKFSLFSGHDTTITPLSVALGIHDGKWPHLASRIVFELYSDEKRKDRYYVKILYNGKNVTPDVRFCKGLTVSGLCKLKYFTHFVRKGNLQELEGKTYKRICHLNTDTF